MGVALQIQCQMWKLVLTRRGRVPVPAADLPYASRPDARVPQSRRGGGEACRQVLAHGEQVVLYGGGLTAVVHVAHPMEIRQGLSHLGQLSGRLGVLVLVEEQRVQLVPHLRDLGSHSGAW